MPIIQTVSTDWICQIKNHIELGHGPYACRRWSHQTLERNKMHKQILIAVSLVACFNAWAEPGGTYILTGEEKNIAEIITADMAKYPELYQGESLDGYISKFKRKNKIGSRTLSPGDPLYFPETTASRKAKKARMEEERALAAERKKQQERLLEERIASFDEKSDTGWIPDAEFREFVAEVRKKGFLTDCYWITEVDGRCSEDGTIEYRFKYERLPDGGRYGWSWWYCMDEKFFEEKKKLFEGMGRTRIHEQSYTLPDGEKRYQAVWQKYEG